MARLCNFSRISRISKAWMIGTFSAAALIGLTADPTVAQQATREIQKYVEQTLEEMVRQGVISPSERQRIRATAAAQQSTAHQQACSSGALSEQECRSGVQQSTAHQQACSSGALSAQECNSGVVLRRRGTSENRSSGLQTVSPPVRPVNLSPPGQGRNAITPQVKPLSERETSLLRQIRQNSDSVVRQYGKCGYNWTQWKKISDDIRTTSVDCGESVKWTIGVSCNRLMVNIFTEQFGWQGWSRPAGPGHETRSGEDEMVAALCANLSR
jgi:hypothetical protein